MDIKRSQTENIAAVLHGAGDLRMVIMIEQYLHFVRVFILLM